jgi:hypothetical protein
MGTPGILRATYTVWHDVVFSRGFLVMMDSIPLLRMDPSVLVDTTSWYYNFGERYDFGWYYDSAELETGALTAV